MPRRFAKDPVVDRSLRHSVRDGIAYSVMAGAGETYFSAFAIFFKATTTQIGLLASLPPLVSSLAQLFSAWLGHKQLSRKQIILSGAVMQAFLWLPLMLLPAMFREAAVAIIIGCIVLYHAAGSVVAPQWSSLMGDLVPEKRRGRYFALRTRYTSVATFLALITAGLVLHFFQKYELALYGFMGIFSLAALARWVSVYHLAAMVEPQHATPALQLLFKEHWWLHIKQSSFLRFSVFFALMQWAVAIGSPFFAVYMLRDLHFSYVEFMSISAASVLMQFLTLNGWGRVSDVFGNRLILAVTGFAIPVIPVMWLFSSNLWYLLGVQLLSGLMWAGFSLSAGNYLYDLIPPRRRVTFLSFHNVFTNLGTFFGALLGGYLGAVMPTILTLGGHSMHWHSVLLSVFLISSAARLLVALVFVPGLKEVRTVRPMTATQLIFRATRFNALSGMIYDIIAAGKRARDAKDANDVKDVKKTVQWVD